MPDHALFPARIVTPEGVAFDDQVQEVVVTSSAGELGILARRAPVVADLNLGRAQVKLEDGTMRTWATAEGFAQASASTATVVVEDAFDVAEASDERLSAIEEPAREAITRGERGEDVPEAQLEASRHTLAWVEHIRSLAGTVAG